MLTYKEKRRARDRKRYWANPEQHRARVRRWQAANPEKCRERRRKWQANNRDRVRAYQRERYAANSAKARERVRAYQRERYAANSAKAREKVRKWCALNRAKVILVRSRNTAKRHGHMPATISIPALEALLTKQKSCQSCGGTPTQKRRLNLDHDHTTGRVRGLLCHPCNLALGNLADDLSRIQALAAYLQRTETI